jgi:prepilin-type N-terminal cleavage/methylation domain-containing protein
MMMVRALRRRLAGEAGLTLVELIVAMSLLAIVLLVFTTTLTAIQTAAAKEDQFTRTTDQARLAMQQLDRQMRSGNVLYDPATESPTSDRWYSIRIYTQTNAAFLCSQWRINADDELVTRTWQPGGDVIANATVTPWRVVAEGILNRSFGVRAFELDDDPLKGDRVLNVDLRVNTDPGSTPIEASELAASFTGRNTSYGYPTSVCASIPDI